MGKRRAVVVVLVIGCHCFVYFLFVHGVSWHDVIANCPEILATDTTTSTTSAPTKAFAPYYVNPHPYRFAINQPNLCVSNSTNATSADPIAVILVCSAIPNFQERQAIRETWGSQASPDKLPVRLAFLLGSTLNKQLQDQIESEATQYGDIIQEDFLDTYLNLTLKSVMLLKWVDQYCLNVKYVMKVDDDMYVNIPNFLKASQKLPYSNNVIYGSLFHGTKPNRKKKYKWYIPISQYPKDVIPDYVSGTAYAMTVDVVTKLYRASLRVPFIQMEDVYITGVCALKAGVRRFNHNGFTYLTRSATGCAFKDAITGHHVTAEQKKKIWKEINSTTSCESNKPKKMNTKPKPTKASRVSVHSGVHSRTDVSS